MGDALKDESELYKALEGLTGAVPGTLGLRVSVLCALRKQSKKSEKSQNTRNATVRKKLGEGRKAQKNTTKMIFQVPLLP